METINERVQKVLKSSSLTQSEFAEKIGIKQGSLSLICSGKSGIGDRTISDICRVFGVNEIWLRTGDGEMLAKKTREEELAEIFARLQYNDDAKSQLICAIARMPDEAFPAFLAFVKQLCKNLTEEAEEAEK
jgi:transcriptional regulator with XRE-family HTH domain